MGRGVGFMALAAVTAVLSGCGAEAKQPNSVDIKTYTVQTVGGAEAKQPTPADIKPSQVQTVEVQGNQPRHCNGLSKAKQAAERKRLEQDLQQLRVAIKTIKGQAVYGNTVVNKAVDQFERDITEEALPIHQR